MEQQPAYTVGSEGGERESDRGPGAESTDHGAIDLLSIDEAERPLCVRPRSVRRWQRGNAGAARQVWRDHGEVGPERGKPGAEVVTRPVPSVEEQEWWLDRPSRRSRGFGQLASAKRYATCDATAPSQSATFGFDGSMTKYSFGACAPLP